MKFTLSWLKDHLETEATLDEILYALTDLGLEVEEVEQAVGWASAHLPLQWRAEARPTQTGTIR